MKLSELMTRSVIRIRPEEPVSVAARMLARFNIGALPVCGADGKLCGMITDRDLVTRCIASGKLPTATTVREIMTPTVMTADPNMEAQTAAALMGRVQIRRLPVVDQDRLCGIISLSDLAANHQTTATATQALEKISKNLSTRD